jgi:hypothetical protein
MWHSGPIEHLSRAARLELADGVTFTEPAWLAMRRPAAAPPALSKAAPKRYFLWWKICPTVDGSLWLPRAAPVIKATPRTDKSGRPSRWAA